MTARRWGCLACVALIAQALPGGQQLPRFRSSAELVLVDVQVREGSRPVGGLTARDFELRDSGVVQQVTSSKFADVPVSVLLALDVSGSVRGETLAELKSAARGAAAALTPDDEAALLTISDRIGLAQSWTRDRAAIDSAIDGLTARGATALADGIYTALGLRHDAAGRTLLVVFSDGLDTSSWLDPHSVVQSARDTDIVVYGVTRRPRLVAESDRESLAVQRHRAALKRWFDSDAALYPEAMLERITEETGGDLLHVDSSRDLPAAFARIVRDFKSRYLIAYTPTRVPGRGWHPLEVKVKGRTVSVRARRGYVR